LRAFARGSGWSRHCRRFALGAITKQSATSVIAIMNSGWCGFLDNPTGANDRVVGDTFVSGRCRAALDSRPQRQNLEDQGPSSMEAEWAPDAVRAGLHS
jgi:hypothetical protein